MSEPPPPSWRTRARTLQRIYRSTRLSRLEFCRRLECSKHTLYRAVNAEIDPSELLGRIAMAPDLFSRPARSERDE